MTETVECPYYDFNYHRPLGRVAMTEKIKQRFQLYRLQDPVPLATPLGQWNDKGEAWLLWLLLLEAQRTPRRLKWFMNREAELYRRRIARLSLVDQMAHAAQVNVPLALDVDRQVFLDPQLSGFSFVRYHQDEFPRFRGYRLELRPDTDLHRNELPASEQLTLQDHVAQFATCFFVSQVLRNGALLQKAQAEYTETREQPEIYVYPSEIFAWPTPTPLALLPRFMTPPCVALLDQRPAPLGKLDSMAWLSYQRRVAKHGGARFGAHLGHVLDERRAGIPHTWLAPDIEDLAMEKDVSCETMATCRACPFGEEMGDEAGVRKAVESLGLSNVQRFMEDWKFQRTKWEARPKATGTPEPSSLCALFRRIVSLHVRDTRSTVKRAYYPVFTPEKYSAEFSFYYQLQLK